jgi:hypothetical protein
MRIGRIKLQKKNLETEGKIWVHTVSLYCLLLHEDEVRRVIAFDIVL